MSFSILVYAFAFIVILWVIVHALLVPKPFPGIPYNTISRYLPWGDMLALGVYNWITGEIFSWFSLHCLKHRSPLSQVFIPSFSTTHPTLVLTDLREIEDMVKRRVGEIDRADMMHTWFGLLTPRATIGLKSKERAFKEQRRLWNVILGPNFMDDVAAERICEVALDLCGLWEKKAEAAGLSTAFEAQADIKLATLDGIWKMNVGSELGLVSASLKSLELPGAVRKSRNSTVVFSRVTMPKFYTTLETLLMCLDWVMQGISPRMYTCFFTYTGILQRAAKQKDEILDRCIASSRDRVKREHGIEEPGISCALDQVVRKELSLTAGKASESSPEGDAALRDELLELLITGHETTASSIAWVLKNLTDNPDMQNRLRTSLYAAFPNATPSKPPSAKDIVTTSLPYVDAVIAETLRLSAIGPVSFRQTLVPCEILGHQVPAGTPIILVTAGPSYSYPFMQTTPEYLRSKTSQASYARRDVEKAPADHAPDASLPSHDPDLSVFDPSRWIRDNGTFDPDAVPMLPFSAGPRGCFGKRIALLEMKIMLVVLFMRFQFPRLEKGLSGYAARDGLTRRPAYCYIRPENVERVEEKDT